MSKPIKEVGVHLHYEENPHVYSYPMNAYEKGSFYCVLKAGGNTVDMYQLADIWRVRTTYEE